MFFCVEERRRRQVAFFVSMDVGEYFELDSVSIKIDGKEVTRMLPGKKSFESLMQSVGLNKDSVVVIVSKGQGNGGKAENEALESIKQSYILNKKK